MELKPCPFCGGEAEYDYCISRKKCITLTKVRCKTCNAGTKVFPCEDEHGNSFESYAEHSAADAWNRRAN